MKKKLLISVIILIGILCVIGYNYVYKDHRNISSEQAHYKGSAAEFSVFFNTDAVAAETKFLNKTVELTGAISDKTPSVITLNDQIFCSLLNQVDLKSLTAETKITIKGRCIGYDDLLEEIKLDQCTIIPTK